MDKQQQRIAVVTGASRGAGKGIALALGSKGYTVYITGRSQQEGDAPLPGTVFQTAQEIDAAGGQGVAVVCDHADDAQVEALFARIQQEHGRLDVLVNNATSINDDIIKPGEFWTKDPALADILGVGLRSAYIASYHAAPLLLANGDGLIVNTSSFGSACYMHNPAYGAQKAGLDKMAWDMAVDFKPHNIAATSIWMGPLITERTQRVWDQNPDQYKEFMGVAETPFFIGLLVDALLHDPKRQEKSGHTLVAAELAQEYGITDEGRQPPSYRDMLGAPLVFSPAIVV